MAMPGGARFGYWATGRVASASRPAIMTRMASAHAKIGRSMKNRDMVDPPSASALGDLVRGRRSRRFMDRHLPARLDLLQAPDDQPIPFRQPVRDDPLVPGRAIHHHIALR